MSLLANAMRQAGESEPTLRELAEELSLELSSEPAAAVRGIPDAKALGSDDAGLFATMEPHAGRRPRTMAVIFVVALLLFAGGGAYVYRATNPPGLGLTARLSSPPSQAMPSAPQAQDQSQPARDDAAQPEAFEERPEPSSRPSPAPAPETASPQAAPDNAIKVRREGPNEINPELAAAYLSLQEGRLDMAGIHYQRLLQQRPGHVDALLGMAAVLARTNQMGEAGRLYLRALEIEPKNTYAQAALLNLSGGSDPAGSEARLKQLLSETGAEFLHFELGNLYAAQGRWTEAQQAYFQSYRLQSANPDHAFNLAVSLEQISQPGAALTYYQRALQLYRRGAGFERAAVEARIAQLQKATE